jgi:hypothetical protein
MSDTDAPPPSERRTEARQLTCIPAYIEATDESPLVALIRDASTTGALLLTRRQLEPGERLKLSLYLTGNAKEARPARGRVARCERRSGDRADVWPWEVGVHFDEPITQYADEIKELTERQASYGLFKHF